jgi:hypothetical protein
VKEIGKVGLVSWVKHFGLLFPEPKFFIPAMTPWEDITSMFILLFQGVKSVSLIN